MSRSLAITAFAIIAVAGLPLYAQQETGGASRSFAKLAASKAKERAQTMIQGNALNSTNGQMSNVVVRLRDARFGRIVDTQVTDKAGLFEFRALEPGTYVVEIVANDQSILAASQLLQVNPGAAVSAIVKLPFRAPVFAGLAGSASAPSATALAAHAALSTVAAIVPTSPVSPNQ
jgi:hypothetical protein